MSVLTFHLIPHTHWDREWYLPRGGFQARLVTMIDDLIGRLQRAPGLRGFVLDGQTVMLEDYLQVRPERRAELGRLVGVGQLQAGPWYVLADELIPSAESLVRNLLLGQADAVGLGRRMDVLYSPDAFGHPAVWPTVAAEFGIPYGVLWRGWGGDSAPARDLARWRGPDGQEVLLYHLPPEGYEVGAILLADPARLARQWAAVRRTLVARATTTQIAVFTGADHHAASPYLADLAERLAGLEPESRFQISRLEDFFRAVEAESPSLGILSGELRWSYGYTWTLQGQHSTRAPLKRRNGHLELQLERLAEPLLALTAGDNRATARALLRHAWRTLVQCQFHDSICGTTSDAVATAMAARMDDVESIAAEVVRTGLHRMTGHDPDLAREHPERIHPAVILWNPAARSRGGVVVADLTFFKRDVLVGPPGRRRPRKGGGRRAFALRDGGGPPIPVQVIRAAPALERIDAARHYPDLDEVERVQIAFETQPLRGFGWRPLTLAPPRRGGGEGAVQARHRTLSNGSVQVTVEPGGALTLSAGRQRFTGLLRLESEADRGDCYTFCPPGRSRVRRSRGPVRTRVRARGPLVGAIEVEYHLPAGTGEGRGAVGIRLLVQVVAGSPVVRCTLAIDNQARDHRLRARLPTGIRAVPVRAGTQFGSINRGTVPVRGAHRMETPVATAPAQRYVAAAGGQRGLALLTPGFFEYEWTAAGDLLLTLLRSVGQLSKADLPTRPGHAAWPTATPLAQCLGVTTVKCGLLAVTGEQIDRGDFLPQAWEDLYTPLQGAWLRDYAGVGLSGGRSDSEDWIELEGAGLVFSAAKPAEHASGMVLRCYNASTQGVEGVWRFGCPRKSAIRVRADEEGDRRLALSAGNRAVRFQAGPGEIVTILLR